MCTTFCFVKFEQRKLFANQSTSAMAKSWFFFSEKSPEIYFKKKEIVKYQLFLFSSYFVVIPNIFVACQGNYGWLIKVFNHWVHSLLSNYFDSLAPANKNHQNTAQRAKTRKKVHFVRTMRCLPQRIKSTVFEIFSSAQFKIFN